MINKGFRLLIISGLMLSLAACQSQPGDYDENIINTSHQAAKILINNAARGTNPNKPLIFASFVNINNLKSSSSFGRIVSQQISTYFTSNGYKVIEMLLRQNVYIEQQQGEFLLSRELKNISEQHNAQAVVVGTYAIGKDAIYITTKMVDAKTNLVISSVDYSLPMTSNTRSLLKGSR